MLFCCGCRGPVPVVVMVMVVIAVVVAVCCCGCRRVVVVVVGVAVVVGEALPAQATAICSRQIILQKVKGPTQPFRNSYANLFRAPLLSWQAVP